jgi:parallel beta-helix repeat protein
MDVAPLRKLITFGILILFALPCFLQSVTGSILEKQNHAFRGVITVDNEGDGDYISIKEAVNNANPGDTIEVYSGTYYEHYIVIEIEEITLKGIPYELGNGSDTGKPFINGEGKEKVFVIKTQDVIIDGFRMENDGPGAYNIISINTESCTIINNDLSHTVMSIFWIRGPNNKILNNNISHSSMRQGIVLVNPCSNCLVSGNIISDCDTGICVWESNHNTITENKIMRCSDFGIDVAGSFNKIIGNHIENNDIGVQIWNFFNQVKRNNFIDNELHAQFIYGIPFLQGLTNIWFGNYWGRPRLLPYPILGLLVLLPIVQFDWRPALLPYRI